MRIKAIGAILWVLLLCSCSETAKGEMPPAQRYTRLQAEQGQSLAEIKIINARTFLRRGESGSITIQGQPGARYTITSSYKLGEKMMTAYNSRVADSDGRVTWSWSVSPETIPGSYPVTITGGGKTLVTSYIVSE